MSDKLDSAASPRSGQKAAQELPEIKHWDLPVDLYPKSSAPSPGATTIDWEEAYRAAIAKIGQQNKALDWIRANKGAHPNNIVAVIDQFCPVAPQDGKGV